MNQIEAVVGSLDGSGKRIGVVAARFNDRVVERLIDGAVDCLRRHGVSAGDIQLVRVPGAWEIPGALDELARAFEPDALIALGVVIRGETPHFDYVAGEASSGISRVGLDRRLPVGFGLLTCDTSSQAEERSRA